MKIVKIIGCTLLGLIMSYCTKEKENIVNKVEVIPAERGAVMLTGRGRPDPSLGEIGDFYMDIEASALYGAKTIQGWGTPISLKGVDGQNGRNGQNGTNGRDGQNGRDGVDGQNGQNGQDGQNGADGRDGARGSVLHTGMTPPTAQIGQIGDWYIDALNQRIYGPKTATGWGIPVIEF
ncbi:collagen-like protein [Capnocytophaga canimorsus]|uniref:collagen-like protein n=1 Tax=Capnocytophaga canimorsus TaxID=28188 RepID=UPI000F7112A9|nr:collagen-like protein [Capnocytophaga canimorsus]GIM58805.1 hypothetical protein CAPN007_10130 [Capnocytophaga canimorsus]VEJ18777.1 Collagen triple helix repeat (20 copies) [Capnocytophaga canimorsus]